MADPWYYPFLACPDCGSSLLVAANQATCGGCGYRSALRADGLDLRPNQPRLATLVFARRSNAAPLPDCVRLDRPVNCYQGPMPGRDSHELVSSMVPSLPRGAKVLDLGCGPRDQAAVFGHLGCDYVGLDFENLAANILADAHALPFQAGAFDVVFSYAVLQHLYNPFLALAEIQRVLKPGGVYCGTVSQGEPFIGSYFHVTAWGIASLVETSGLTLERLWPSYDTLRALVKLGRYPRVIKLLIRAVDLLHTHVPVLGVRKAFTWTERQKQLDELYRAASICFLVRKAVPASVRSAPA
jgi:SAM-dependent methyltransferase